MVAKTLHVAETVIILFTGCDTDADWFTAIVRIEGVINDIDRVPSVLIVARNCVDGYAALHHTRSV